ncbi:hypothetical protein TRFO_05924 [Tritrichomonas foetus]|uniref:UBA domain-containing protein n=1 Tax=Tritrichomonas foetus TaxID=1144522 RepID=A0A1J4K2C4_9EUKA|nr:hypothetical protein TRFO_05924 [Tritrichomonas foetus]|eukprot:OHT05347.1 hypothetical protein TRFO_05924 [Tritrichomonas foetus]
MPFYRMLCHLRDITGNRYQCSLSERSTVADVCLTLSQQIGIKPENIRIIDPKKGENRFLDDYTAINTFKNLKYLTFQKLCEPKTIRNNDHLKNVNEKLIINVPNHLSATMKSACQKPHYSALSLYRQYAQLSTNKPSDFDNRVEMLHQMGFDLDECKEALRSCGNNVEKASNYLLTMKSEKKSFYHNKNMNPFDLLEMHDFSDVTYGPRPYISMFRRYESHRDSLFSPYTRGNISRDMTKIMDEIHFIDRILTKHIDQTNQTKMVQQLHISLNEIQSVFQNRVTLFPPSIVSLIRITLDRIKDIFEEESLIMRDIEKIRQEIQSNQRGSDIDFSSRHSRRDNENDSQRDLKRKLHKEPKRDSRRNRNDYPMRNHQLANRLPHTNEQLQRDTLIPFPILEEETIDEFFNQIANNCFIYTEFEHHDYDHPVTPRNYQRRYNPPHLTSDKNMFCYSMTFSNMGDRERRLITDDIDDFEDFDNFLDFDDDFIEYERKNDKFINKHELNQHSSSSAISKPPHSTSKPPPSSSFTSKSLLPRKTAMQQTAIQKTQKLSKTPEKTIEFSRASKPNTHKIKNIQQPPPVPNQHTHTPSRSVQEQRNNRRFPDYSHSRDDDYQFAIEFARTNDLQITLVLDILRQSDFNREILYEVFAS